MLPSLVNFFGHAAIASVDPRPEAATTLGAMLPDFATMCGVRLIAHEPDAAPTDALRRGIALHHATDAVFHAAPPVVALMRELDERLAGLGCARGPRRATAHIGVELLLDGVWVDDAGFGEAYLAALAHDAADIPWRDDAAPPRFAVLRARLRGHGVPFDLRKPSAITQRLQRILGHRPLLAPSASDLTAIERALTEHQPRVTVAADAVMRFVRAAMRDTPDVTTSISS